MNEGTEERVRGGWEKIACVGQDEKSFYNER